MLKACSVLKLSKRRSVTSEVASSSLVHPAIRMTRSGVAFAPDLFIFQMTCCPEMEPKMELLSRVLALRFALRS